MEELTPVTQLTCFIKHVEGKKNHNEIKLGDEKTNQRDLSIVALCSSVSGGVHELLPALGRRYNTRLFSPLTTGLPSQGI